MSVSFNRRSKVLLALVAAMTLGSGVLLRLAPTPLKPPTESLAGIAVQPTDPLAFSGREQQWQRVIIHASGDTDTTLGKLESAAARTGQLCHFVVAANGRVEPSSRWDKQKAWTDGGKADEIHVMLVGKFDAQTPTNEVQLNALKNGLLKPLFEKWDKMEKTARMDPSALKKWESWAGR